MIFRDRCEFEGNEVQVKEIDNSIRVVGADIPLGDIDDIVAYLVLRIKNFGTTGLLDVSVLLDSFEGVAKTYRLNNRLSNPTPLDLLVQSKEVFAIISKKDLTTELIVDYSRSCNIKVMKYFKGSSHAIVSTIIDTDDSNKVRSKTIYSEEDYLFVPMFSLYCCAKAFLLFLDESPVPVSVNSSAGNLKVRSLQASDRSNMTVRSIREGKIFISSLSGHCHALDVCSLRNVR